MLETFSLFFAPETVFAAEYKHKYAQDEFF